MNKHFFLLGISIAAALLTACNGVSNREDDKLLTPVLNPKPKQVVKVFGRAPESLEISLGVSYSPSSKAKGCEQPETPLKDLLPFPDADTLAKMLIEGRKYGRGHELKITRKGEYFETSFVVDKYLPGFCQWEYSGGGASAVKDGLKLYYSIGLFENAAEVNTSNDPDYCKFAPKNKRCVLVANADPTPVYVRCKILGTERTKPGDRPPELHCESREPVSFKKEHLVMPHTREIEVRFYDLDEEPDPIKDLIDAYWREKELERYPPYPYSDKQ
jgi:hypothetical protein